MSETPETCSHPIWEPCKLHPVDCPRCTNSDTCQMKADMQAHPDLIKSCRFFRAKGQSHL